MDPFFRRFFQAPGARTPQQRVQRGQGSGVIFDAKGLLLTNAHVVEGADTLSVELTDGRRAEGAVVGTDPLTDLAVVRLEGKGPGPIAVLGDSDRLRVGDWAIAVGNPFGLENTVTMGIISNLNRNVSQLGISGKRLDLIQTDAAINPGNSGGPLLNADGEVVGINTLVRSGPGAGLGFAIPINRAQNIARQLVATGRASHPVIGIGLANGPNGPVIRSVQPGAPASKAGLQPEDQIVSIDGQPMKGAADVVAAIDRKGVGRLLTMTVVRGETRLEVSLKPMDLARLKS
jgi:S1-C subfamily serine protease